MKGNGRKILQVVLSTGTGRTLEEMELQRLVQAEGLPVKVQGLRQVKHI